ncbi:hypothetical protein MHYP_G00329690 [Metynnis hypsauchen]
MLVQLRLRERRSCPPPFLELLTEVREEEDRQMVQRKSAPVAVKATVRQLSATKDIIADVSDTATLRTEIDELKTKVFKLSNKKSNHPPVHVADGSSQSNEKTSLDERTAVQSIQQQVSDLQHQLQAMAVTLQDTTFKAQRGRAGREVPVRLTSFGHRDQQKGSTDVSRRGTFFCYRCGEDGHVARSLAIWGLGDSSYPYKGYVAVSVEFLDDGDWRQAKSILALVCPDPPGPDQVPVIIGTNARSFHHGPSDKPKEREHDNPAQIWCGNALPEGYGESSPQNTPVDECTGHVEWVGPGPLTIPAGESRHAVCKAVVNQGEKPSVLVIDSFSMLPAGITLPPCVLLPSDIQQNTVSLWIKNETLKDKAIPKGSIIAHIYRTDIVTEVKAETDLVDYRTLNARTVPDQYTIPRVDDALDCLSGSKWFTVFSLS